MGRTTVGVDAHIDPPIKGNLLETRADVGISPYNFVYIFIIKLLRHSHFNRIALWLF